MTAMEKNNKTLNVPNLRFPEFSGEWERSNLKRFATKLVSTSFIDICFFLFYTYTAAVCFFNNGKPNS